MSTLFGWSELVAAAVGALSAYTLEKFRRRSERLTEIQDAVNSAQVAMSQMYQHLKNIHEQVYIAQEKRVRDAHQREPLAFEILPLTVTTQPSVNIDVSSLACLLRSHDPDVVHRVASAERTYIEHVMNEEVRAGKHLEVQNRLHAAGVKEGVPTAPAQMIEAIGSPLYKQLQMLTQYQTEELPKTADFVLKVHEELRDVASLQFPTRHFIRFEPRENIDTTLPPIKASKWRYVVRTISKWWRKRGWSFTETPNDRDSNRT